MRNEGLDMLGPLNDEMESIKTFEKSVQANLQEYEQLSEEGLLKEKKAMLGNYIGELRYLLDLAATARQLIAILPNSVEDLLARLDNRKSEIEKDLRKTYFLRPLPVYYFSLEGWRGAYEGTRNGSVLSPTGRFPSKEAGEFFGTIL